MGSTRKLGFLALGVVALCLPNAWFLGRIAYAVAWPGDLRSLERGAALVPFTSDSYAPDLSLRAGVVLDSEGQPERALRRYRASLAEDPYLAPAWSSPPTGPR